MKTLSKATTIFRLNDPTVTNAEIARQLDLWHENGDHKGLPNCCFFRDGRIAAIRTAEDEISIFHLFASVTTSMQAIGERVIKA